jgi:hypothetical protein
VGDNAGFAGAKAQECRFKIANSYYLFI